MAEIAGADKPKRWSMADALPGVSTTTYLTGRSSAEFSSKFDFCMVFGMLDSGEGPMTQSDEAKTVMFALLSAGLEVYPYLSVQKDELYCLIRAPLEKLQAFADSENFLLAVDEVTLERVLKEGDAESKIAPIEITDDPEITKLSPYQYMFLEFRDSLNPDLYYKAPGYQHPFKKIIRLKLIMGMLRAPKKKGGCDLEISKMLLRKQVLALYPMHDFDIVDDLEKQCLDWLSMPWNSPTHDLKEYFGEKIALYVVFLGHYSLCLLIPSVIGLIFQLIVFASGNYSHPVMAFYSLLITVWGVAMLEYWKRKESYTALQWGMTSFETHEQDRPEFHGTLIKSHIDGSEMIYFPEKKAQRLQMFSRSIVTTFILGVAAVVAGIYWIRYYLQQSEDTSLFASFIASVMNAVQIQVFNLIYQNIVVSLTNNENHRTDTLYEDSMITKLFLFQFMNSYSSFFFLAFVASYVTKPDGAPEDSVGQCGAATCMEPLAINLAIIFGTRLVFNNLLDIFLPYIKWRHKTQRETAGVASDVLLTPAEGDYLLVEYRPMLENISAYAETTIQFGYCMLFISALPMATLLSLINNWARVKFYTYKLFRFYQRPSPNGAQDIGTWMSIFQFLACAAVVTNAALICFTMDVLWSHYEIQFRLWIFIGFQWGLFLLQYAASELINDVPHEVLIQMQRNEFINLKVVEKLSDEDFGSYGQNHHQGEEDLAEVGSKMPIHCGNILCCKARKTVRKQTTRRMRSDLADMPELTYPFKEEGGGWPDALRKDSLMESGAERKMAAKAAAQLGQVGTSYDTGRYVGTEAAAAAPATAAPAAAAPAAAAAAAAAPAAAASAAPAPAAAAAAVPAPASPMAVELGPFISGVKPPAAYSAYSAVPSAPEALSALPAPPAKP